ncbi:hypothetical protein [Corallococcus sp. CA054B]|uniref:hypothetical protein n=1 Tax=Corallococcus sp. CA054B TaxID=2316734 RepID=UPI0011C3CC1B|nr:hypothetical protein [Corallococcus sp. CA054B]
MQKEVREGRGVGRRSKRAGHAKHGSSSQSAERNFGTSRLASVVSKLSPRRKGRGASMGDPIMKMWIIKAVGTTAAVLQLVYGLLKIHWDK